MNWLGGLALIWHLAMAHVRLWWLSRWLPWKRCRRRRRGSERGRRSSDLRWWHENDVAELALAAAGLASAEAMVVVGNVNEGARCSGARKHGGPRVWYSDEGAMVARWWPRVAEDGVRWSTRKTTPRLESWRRGSGRFEMLERDGGGVSTRARRGGSSPAGARRVAAFRRELRLSDEVVAATKVATTEWIDYGGCRGGCHGSDVVDDDAEVNEVDALRWWHENDVAELALAAAGLASAEAMVVVGNVNEGARCSGARKHGGPRVWYSDEGAMVARWWPRVAEDGVRWSTRKTTPRLESWRRGSGRFEMLERDGGGVSTRARRGGSSPAGARRVAAFRRELRLSDEVVAATKVATTEWIGAEEREEGD
ncbi:hypothetical protein DEO72_LG8g1339 [Vigna unguiculata]|uniref:Uncharacterized protein n=1 Tax=Vigna unguiculata TaxID=3917 RepID=A0A4D6MTW7_VIGUN|nr:hypothetical protein DEO72_LG8g1339 [Vigna unguiculata]